MKCPQCNNELERGWFRYKKCRRCEEIANDASKYSQSSTYGSYTATPARIREEDEDDGFATSMAIGAMTGSGIEGGLLGGNFAGGMLGAALNSRSEACESYSGGGSFGGGGSSSSWSDSSSSNDSSSSSYDSGSCSSDSSSSYDSGSSSCDSGSSGGGSD